MLPIQLNILPTTNLTRLVQLNILPSNPPIKKEVVRKYTLQIFLRRAYEVHGNKFDYSLVKEEDISNSISKVPVTCHKHEEPFIWFPSINGHLKPNQKFGCPQCSGKFKYTLDIFLQRAKIIHNNKYDYTLIKEEDVTGAFAKVSIICKNHESPYLFYQAISNHINSKQGCPSCFGNTSYTLELFLEKAKSVHNDKYSYELVTEEHIKGAHSKVPIICYNHITPYKWDIQLTNHINGDRSCPMCTGNAKYNLEYFLTRAREIHGDSYDYSMITEEHIKGAKSYVPIKCKQCNNIWTPTASGHISAKHRCKFCYGNVPWTLTRFIEEANEIHNNKYNYDLIKEEDISNEKSKVYIRCNKFGHVFHQSLNNHIYQASGCKHCTKSRGYSQMQIDWLEGLMKQQNITIQYALSPQGEFKVPGVGKVDGFHEETGTVYEFNGDYFHGSPSLYKPEDINKKVNKTFGELYQKTLVREQKIRDLGYNLIVMWELDYKNSLKSK